MVVKETQSFTLDNGVDPVISSQTAGEVPPVIEQRRRRVLFVAESPCPWPGRCLPDVAAIDFGRGMVRVMGLWNLRRRGSMVTIGETDTWVPTRRVTISDVFFLLWKPAIS